MGRRTFSGSVRLGGQSVAFQITRDEEGEDSQNPLLTTVAKAGQLTTRTNNVSGVITAANHAFVVNQSICVFWSGTSPGVAREAVISNTTSNTLTFGSATGDSLPSVNTNVNVGTLNTLNLSLVASSVVMAAVSASKRASVEFQTSANAAVVSLDLGKSGNNNEGWAWWSLAQQSTPFGSNVARVRLSNGDVANSNQVVIGALSNTLS